jgi:hypothetical protein
MQFHPMLLYRTVVRLGDLNLDDSVADRASPIDVPVEKTFVHENYNPTAHTVDIALVKLKNRVEFTSELKPTLFCQRLV